jgi:hypothetical protein
MITIRSCTALVFLGAIFLFAHSNSLSQNFSKEAVDEKLQALSEIEQANYIHDNFYKIYGADLGNGKEFQSLRRRVSHQSS